MGSKIWRIRKWWKDIDETCRRILVSTYVFSAVKYSSAIYYPYLAPSTKKRIETIIRGMTKHVYKSHKAANNNYI